MALNTRSRVSGLINALLASTRETVAVDTPAALATSLIVVIAVNYTHCAHKLCFSKVGNMDMDILCRSFAIQSERCQPIYSPDYKPMQKNTLIKLFLFMPIKAAGKRSPMPNYWNRPTASL